MDSLKTIQKTFRIFLRLTHAAKILCIVGTVLSGAGALCLMTSYYGGHVFDLFGKPVMIFHPDTNWKQQGVELLAASIRMMDKVAEAEELGLDSRPSTLEKLAELAGAKEKCDAPECDPTVCRKARDAHEL